MNIDKSSKINLFLSILLILNVACALYAYPDTLRLSLQDDTIKRIENVIETSVSLRIKSGEDFISKEEGLVTIAYHDLEGAFDIKNRRDLYLPMTCSENGKNLKYFILEHIISGLMEMQGYEDLRRYIFTTICENKSNKGGVTIAVAKREFMGNAQARRVIDEQGTNFILLNEDFYNSVRKAENIISSTQSETKKIRERKTRALRYIVFERLIHELCEDIEPLLQAGSRHKSQLLKIEAASFLNDALMYHDLVYTKGTYPTLKDDIELLLGDPDIKELKPFFTLKERFTTLKKACIAFGKVDIQNPSPKWRKVARDFVKSAYTDFSITGIREAATSL